MRNLSHADSHHRSEEGEREMNVQEAIKALQRALKRDKGYYESWKANIAMAYRDTEGWYKANSKKRYLNKKDKRLIANDAADYFLKLLIRDIA
jgi:hypothetical protein